MDWLNLHIPTALRSPEYIGSSPAERGTWLSVLAYAAEIECGGRLIGAAAWKDRQWQQACGVTLKEMRAAARLLRMDGDDVLVNGYPVAKETQVRQARGIGMAGAMARWSKVDADRHGVSMPTGMPTANAEGEGEGEGKGKSKDTRVTDRDQDPFKPTSQAPAAAPNPAPLNLSARLREPYREIAESEGGADIGFLTATRALEAARRIFGTPSPDQLLATYRCAREAGCLASASASWPDFRKRMKAEKLHDQSKTTAAHSEDDRSYFARWDQRAKQ
jgi:hypothetical protein